MNTSKLEDSMRQALATYTAEAYQRGRKDEAKAQNWWIWGAIAFAVIADRLIFSGGC